MAQRVNDSSGFDLSVSEWGPELRGDNKVNARAQYKIGAADRHDADPKEYSLPGIIQELGHDFIDIWKVPRTVQVRVGCGRGSRSYRRDTLEKDMKMPE
jgi:hypothetical protein